MGSKKAAEKEPVMIKGQEIKIAGCEKYLGDWIHEKLLTIEYKFSRRRNE